MSEVDDRDFQAFNELQRRLLDNTEKQKYAQQQMQMAHQARRRAELTAREMHSLSDSTPIYKATGKAYFRAPRQKLVKDLQDQAENSSTEIDTMKESEASLRQSLSGIENEIRELLSSSKQLAEAFAAAKGV